MRNHYAAMGDSFTQGIGDEVDGVPLRSWVEHFAELHTPQLAFTNLAKRGLLTRQIRMRQLDKALALQPGLVSLIAGANDILKGYWNREEYINEMELMSDSLKKAGAAVIIANLPDFTVRLPMPAEQKQVIRDQLIDANAITQTICDKYQFQYIDCWNHPIAKDDSLWSADRIHLNSKGYREVARIFYDQLNRG